MADNTLLAMSAMKRSLASASVSAIILITSSAVLVSTVVLASVSSDTSSDSEPGRDSDGLCKFG